MQHAGRPEGKRGEPGRPQTSEKTASPPRPTRPPPRGEDPFFPGRPGAARPKWPQPQTKSPLKGRRSTNAPPRKRSAQPGRASRPEPAREAPLAGGRNDPKARPELHKQTPPQPAQERGNRSALGWRTGGGRHGAWAFQEVAVAGGAEQGFSMVELESALFHASPALKRGKRRRGRPGVGLVKPSNRVQPTAIQNTVNVLNSILLRSHLRRVACPSSVGEKNWVPGKTPRGLTNHPPHP